MLLLLLLLLLLFGLWAIADRLEPCLVPTRRAVPVPDSDGGFKVYGIKI